MSRKSINPKTLFSSVPYGFSQVVVADPGKIVAVSGQVAWDENQNIVGENDLGKQTEKAMANVKTAIEAAGGTMEDIIMLRIYKVKYQKEDGAVINQVLRDTFGTQHPPASTWVSVDGLANEDFMIELEALAVI
ncbi:MAG: RidA family protein [Bacteroidales bacterium]